MFRGKEWLAVVRDDQWTVAKVRVRRRKRRIDVLRLFQIEIAPDDGNNPRGGAHEVKPVEQEVRREELQFEDWLHKHKVPRTLKMALSCPGVITRIIVLPKMATKDLEKLLTEQADQYFTLNIEDYLVDYRVLEHFVEEGQKRQRVLLAALPRTFWLKFWHTCQEAGLKPATVDLAVDSIVRIYSHLSQGTQGKGEAKVPLDLAIVELSRERAEFILLEQGIFFLHSDVEVALENFAASLHSDLWPIEVPAQDKVSNLPDSGPQVSLAEPEVAVSASGEEQLWDGAVSADSGRKPRELFRAGLELSLEPVLRTLAEFFSFFAARHFGKSIDHLFITGEWADLPFLEELFAENLGVKVSIGFPQGWQPHFQKKMRERQPEWMKYAALYGMALRED